MPPEMLPDLASFVEALVTVHEREGIRGSHVYWAVLKALAKAAADRPAA